MDKIYLCSDNGFTGETFRDWADVYQWYTETTGQKLTAKERLNIKNGKHFKVGSRYYNCMVSEESLAEVA
jgi:hypothetical protein